MTNITPLVAASTMSRGLQAYHALRLSIHKGELKPGTRLREVELAERLGFSRTPIREALSRLENEGLITNDALNGLIVTQLDYQMVDELYAMREVLEGTAAKLAAENATTTEISILEKILAQDQNCLDDPIKLAANNRIFHEMLYQCAHNRYLLKMANSLQETMSLLGVTTLSDAARAKESNLEHSMLIAAIKNKDAILAEEIARQHLRSAYQARVRLLVQERLNS